MTGPLFDPETFLASPGGGYFHLPTLAPCPCGQVVFWIGATTGAARCPFCLPPKGSDVIVGRIDMVRKRIIPNGQTSRKA